MIQNAASCQTKKRGVHVDVAHECAADGPGPDAAGPARNAGHAEATLPGLALEAAQQAVARALLGGRRREVRFSERPKSPASGLQAADTHLWIAMHGRAIVTGEEHEGIVVGSTLLEGTHDLAHGPVNLFHSVADGASTRAAAKGRTACVGFVNVIERYLHMTKAR